jgi:pimeloyl-ACP methyl ester carboxylesterase
VTQPLAGRPVRANGIELSVTEAGEGPAVVLLHGFPELAYSWRHQLPALAEAGYRAIAPDMRGYGRSSRPDAITDYDLEHLCGDVIGLLDELGIDRAVVVGHDWGSMVAWGLAVRAPDRLHGVVGMSVPFIPRPSRPPVANFDAQHPDTFFYISYFQQPGVADTDLGRDPAMTVTRVMLALSAGVADSGFLGAADGRGFVERLPDVGALPAWITQDELDVYIAEFTRTGFTGGINWYRNMDRNWERSAHLADVQVEVPALFVAGADDPVILAWSPDRMEGWLRDPRGTVIVDGAGHWVQQEKPAEVNAALVEFLGGLGLGLG